MESEDHAEVGLRCARCEQPLPSGVTVCQGCSPPAEGTDPQRRQVKMLLDQASRRLFAGFGLFLVVLAPLALQTVLQAEALLKEAQIVDPALVARARRLRYGTIAASLFACGLIALFLRIVRQR